MDWVGQLSGVGAAIEHRAAGFWFASRKRVDAGMLDAPPDGDGFPPAPFTGKGWLGEQALGLTALPPDAHQVGDPHEHATLLRLWDPLWGDHRQEIAIIGVDLDEPALRAQLDACPLRDDEMLGGPAVWRMLPTRSRAGRPDEQRCPRKPAARHQERSA